MTTIQLESSAPASRAPRVASEQLLGGNVRMTIANAHVQWVRDYHGDVAVQTLLAALPDGIRQALHLGDDGWLPFGTLIALDRAIDERFGRGRRHFLRELGRYSAHLNLSPRGVRGEAVHDFLHRLSRLHTQFHDVGRLVYEEHDPTRGRIVLRGAVCYSPVWCASAIGYYEQTLLMLHAVPVRVEESRCRAAASEACTFELEWE